MSIRSLWANETARSHLQKELADTRARLSSLVGNLEDKDGRIRDASAQVTLTAGSTSEGLCQLCTDWVDLIIWTL